jgi:RND family efflux transporter MFP subunit
MYKTIYTIFFVAAILYGCDNDQNSQGHSHDVIGTEDAHDHGEELSTLSYTIFADGYELFVEFPPLVVGNVSAFAAHFTRLADYKPLTAGQLTVSIAKDGKGIRHAVDGPTSPGIFRPALQPKETGTYNLFFLLKTEKGESRFDLGEIEVYPDSENIPGETGGGEGGITFLKEQAWKTDFATQEIVESSFYSVIATSAKVKSQPQAEIVLNAQSSGKVILNSIIGESVNRGQLLAIVTGSGIENNISVKLDEYQIAFEKSKSDYNRTKPLVDKQAISQKDFLEIESRYKQDSIRYYQVANNISGNGLKISAPFSGMVTGVHVRNGDFVDSGEEIITVTQKDRMLIEAYVNQKDYQQVEDIFDAHFRVPSGDLVIRLSDINGQVKSKNAFVSENSTRIPVSFAISGSEVIMPGMLLEAFLLTGKHESTLVVPLSGVIEEQGQYYVFVQTRGESFEKRQIGIGENDGLSAEVVSGLKAGDRIVTTGAYQVKLAAMAGDLPLHGHTH